MCYEIKSLQKKKKEKKNLPPAGDVISGRFFCVASDTFIETKEAPVAVLSVAANSRV